MDARFLRANDSFFCEMMGINSIFEGRLGQAMLAWLPRQCLICRDTLSVPNNALPLPIMPAWQSLGESWRSRRLMCADCLIRLPWMPSNHLCYHCQSPIHGEGLCSHCAAGELSAIDCVRAVWAYRTPIDRLIIKLKHHPDRAILRVFAESLITLFAHFPEPAIDAVISVPMHPHRLMERGFNQSALLSQAFYRRMPKRSSIGHENFWVDKIRDTHSQQGRSRQERFLAMRHAFRAQKSVHGKHVLIIDDVMTTGATLQAMAHALKKQGAQKVSALTLARASHPTGSSK